MARHLKGETTHNPVGLSERQTIGRIPAGHTTLGLGSAKPALHRVGFPPQITIFKRLSCGHSTLLNIQKTGGFLNTSRITIAEVHLSFTTVRSVQLLSGQSHGRVSVFPAYCCNPRARDQPVKIGWRRRRSYTADWVQSYQYPISFNQRPSSASVFCQIWATVTLFVLVLFLLLFAVCASRFSFFSPFFLPHLSRAFHGVIMGHAWILIWCFQGFRSGWNWNCSIFTIVTIWLNRPPFR